MKYFIIIFLIITMIGCKEQVRKQPQAVTPEIGELTGFFSICKTDIKKAVKIVSDYKMVANLTHLRRMDTGGKKYYILERDNLTEMIMAVTEGTYSDLILINKSGFIIYTMKNNDLFGKHVKHHYKDTSLLNCFNRSMNGFHIEDVSMFPDENGQPSVLVAYPDIGENQVRGVFIIQIDTEIISSILKNESIVIGTDGKYRIDKNPDNLYKPYLYFNKIDTEKLKAQQKFQFKNEGKIYTCYPFSYNILDWIIIYPE